MMTERKAAYPCTSCSVIGKQHCGKTCERYLGWLSQEWTIIREAAEALRRRARRGKEKER